MRRVNITPVHTGMRPVIKFKSTCLISIDFQLSSIPRTELVSYYTVRKTCFAKKQTKKLYFDMK